MADIVSEYNKTYRQSDIFPILDEFAFNNDGTLRAGIGSSLRRLVPKAPPVPYSRPPKPPFKMPRYGTKVVFPAIGKVILSEGKQAVEDKINSVRNDLNYICPNPYDGLINEAVLDHFRKYVK